MDSSAVVTPPYVAGPLRLYPFRGLMLSPSRIGDPSSARAFARPYRDVAARLTSWERRGLVHHDTEPAVYLHEYTVAGIVVRGLVGALDISRRATSRADRAVYPHEGVHPAQAEELAERMAEMQMNPAPILLVHRGPAAVRTLLARVAAAPPTHEFTDRAEQEHRVWAITDPDDLGALEAALAGSRALIADGHHRYAAYLRLQRDDPGGSHDLGLAMLVDQDETPLFLGAIHRVLVGTGLDDLRDACDRIGATFHRTTETAAVGALAPGCLAATDGTTWATLALPVPHGRAAVEVLHEQLVPALTDEPARIGYHHAVEEAMAHLSRSKGTALLMPAPDFDLVLRIVAAGRLLPEKATSFQPKPSVGVLIRSLLDGAPDRH
ncbi:DUF1015 family protein [Nocardioides sp. KIGAM211]|uniref:DUF1015 family protein n=1 Tax=Nocardioides luti TaxID=2761101 RepID=A0A7X0RCF8_9ACTN|nr:DUF1015 family protein [Nocardioides luti]MBB6625690.1 DUF1015 family protein [Nocardioides luti]